MTAHVALLALMFSRSKNFFEHFIPIPYRLTIYFYNHMLYDRRSNTFVGQGELNRAVAGIEFKDWPDRRANLLALHVGGVTGDAQSQESNNGRDHYVVSAGTARLLLVRHAADHIAVDLSVNQSGS